MKKTFLITLYSTFLFSKELITPIPLEIDHNKEKALLGKKLFFETMLSKDNTISCASCHILSEGGDDNLSVSFGVNGQKGTRNSPTVLNSSFNSVQFWDGRAETLEDQAQGPIHNPVEMNSNFDEVVAKLQKEPYYRQFFKKVYKNGITGPNIVNAIAEYEKTLITPDSRFDKYLRGDISVLTKDEKNGYKLFKEYGCISCHNGVNIGGNLMQKVGIIEDFETKDYGLYHITKKEEDRYYFKVPTLRNIEQTAPYFHNGLTSTLKDAVKKMSFYQIGYELTDKEITDITKFLKTLTGKQNFDKNTQ